MKNPTLVQPQRGKFNWKYYRVVPQTGMAQRLFFKEVFPVPEAETRNSGQWYVVDHGPNFVALQRGRPALVSEGAKVLIRNAEQYLFPADFPSWWIRQLPIQYDPAANCYRRAKW